MDDVGILTTVLENMLVQISSGYARLCYYAKPLFYCLLTFQFVFLGLSIALNKGDAVSGFMKTSMRASFYLYIIANMPAINDEILRFASELGFGFGGSTHLGWMFKDPSAIADYGIRTVQPLLNWINSLGIYQLTSQYPSIICTLVVIICILCTFFYLSFQVFMTLLEFYFCTAGVAIFLGFRVFSVSAWMSDGAVKAFFTHAVKIFVLCVIISIIKPMMDEFNQMQTIGVKASNIFPILLSSVLLWLLSMKAGSWAHALTSGAPSLGAGDLVKAAASATAGFAAGALGGAGVLKAGAQIAQKASGVSTQTGAGMASGIDKARGVLSGLKNMTQGSNGFKGQLKASMQKSSSVSSGQSSARSSGGAVKTLANSFKNSYNTSKRIQEVGQGFESIGG